MIVYGIKDENIGYDLQLVIEDLRVLTNNITTINNCIYTYSKGNCYLF